MHTTHTRSVNKGTMGERETRGGDDDKVSWFDGGRLKLVRSRQGREREKVEEECRRQSTTGGRAREDKQPWWPVFRSKSTERPHVSVSCNYIMLRHLTPITELMADQSKVAVICLIKTEFTGIHYFLQQSQKPFIFNCLGLFREFFHYSCCVLCWGQNKVKSIIYCRLWYIQDPNIRQRIYQTPWFFLLQNSTIFYVTSKEKAVNKMPQKLTQESMAVVLHWLGLIKTQSVPWIRDHVR